MSFSIFHRFTGLVLSAGSVLIALWLFSIAGGADAYALSQAFIGHWVGTVVLILWSFAFYYHLCNGIRHLFWDIGRGFELPAARKSAAVVAVVTVLLTAATWVWAWTVNGGGA